MSNPLFSILIAQYNNGKYFEDCYKSIMAQTYTNWEAIIVDDCSTDDSVELMKKLIGDDTRFTIYSNDENKGCGFTKRKCTDFASGEICGFLDPDDAITKTAIEEMVRAHSELPDVGLVYSNFIYCDENLKPQKIHEQKIVVSLLPDFFNIEGQISHFATFKNSFYKKTTGIDAFLQRAVDQDLYLKLYEVGEVSYLNRDLYYYRIHDAGISTNLNARKARYWHLVGIIAAARRRNINIENLFGIIEPVSQREISVNIEIANYNKSIIFKALRKIGLFKI